MYIYPRPLHEPGALKKLHEFCADGYLEVVRTLAGCNVGL